MDTLRQHQMVMLELLKELDQICHKHNITYCLFAGSALGAALYKGFIPWDDDLDVAMLRSDYEKFLKIAPAELSEQYYLQAEFSEHWPMNFSKLRKNNTTCLEKYHPKNRQTHQGIYIDILPIDNATESEIGRKWQFYASRVVLAKALFRRGYDTNQKRKKIFMLFCRLLPIKPFLKMTMKKKRTDSKYVHAYLGGSSNFKKGVYLRKWISETIPMEFEGIQVPVSAHYHEMLTRMYGDYVTNLPSEEERIIKKHAILVDTKRNYTEYENYRDGMTFDVHTRSIR